MIELYGIPNCSSVKKAREWLAKHELAYEFHDFKKTPPSTEWLSGCLKQVSLDVLLNKRGTTWRNLAPESQNQANTMEGAIALMHAHPSVIKRPVLIYQDQICVGFDEAQYQQLFQAA